MDSRIGFFFILLFVAFGLLFQRREEASPTLVAEVVRGPTVIVSEKPKSVPRVPAATNTEASVPAVAVTTEDLCTWIKGGAAPKQFHSEAQAVIRSFDKTLSPEHVDVLDWLFQTPDRKPSSNQATSLLFLEGLEEGGMLLGRSSGHRLDVAKSISLLEKAQAQDQSNGALDLYLASLYQRQGRSNEAIESLRRGLRKDRFDLYMTGISKQLLAAPKTSLEFVKAVELFSTMPIPDMNPLREALLALTRSADFSPDIFRFAEKIVDEAVSSRAPYNHLDWWLSSYVMASQILQRRGQHVPRSFDLHQEYNLFPDLSVMLMPEQRCQPMELERSIQAFQALIRPSVFR